VQQDEVQSKMKFKQHGYQVLKPYHSVADISNANEHRVCFHSVV